MTKWQIAWVLPHGSASAGVLPSAGDAVSDRNEFREAKKLPGQSITRASNTDSPASQSGVEMFLGLVSKLDSWEQKLHWLSEAKIISSAAGFPHPSYLLVKPKPRSENTFVSASWTQHVSVFTPANTS